MERIEGKDRIEELAKVIVSCREPDPLAGLAACVCDLDRCRAEHILNAGYIPKSEVMSEGEIEKQLQGVLDFYVDTECPSAKELVAALSGKVVKQDSIPISKIVEVIDKFFGDWEGYKLALKQGLGIKEDK